MFRMLYRDKILITSIIFLLPLTALKFSSIKLYEVVYILITLVSLIKVKHFYSNKYYLGMFLFVIIGFILSIPSFFSDFYLPSKDINIFNYPIIVTISRCVQLLLGIIIALIIFNLLKNKQNFLHCLKSYIIIGNIICCFAIVSGLINYLADDQLLLGAYTDMSHSIRLQGSFQEGGPFGVYLVSLLIIEYIFFDFQKHKIKYLCYVLAFITLFLCYSKASYVAIFVLGMYAFFLKKGNVRYLLVGSALFAVFYYIGFGDIQGYYNAIFNMDIVEIQKNHANDPNFMMGRIAGMRIIPNMIKEHYLIGIGLGNYPILRNNPLYSKDFPQTNQWDNTGLGILDVFAEVGIPLSLVFLWLLYYPINIAKTNNVKSQYFFLAAFQLISSMVGVQITFIYPWITTAIFFSYIKLLNKNVLER